MKQVPFDSRDLKLAEQVDLLTRLRADTQVSIADLRHRESDFKRHLQLSELQGEAHKPNQGRDLLRLWLDFVYRSERRPGEIYFTWVRRLGVLMGILGLVLGWSTARLILRYDGSAPINVIEYLAVFVIAQILLMGLLCLVLIIHFLSAAIGRARRQPLPVYGSFNGRRRNGGWIAQGMRQLLAKKAEHACVPPVLETCLLLLLTQVFGVAFNVAALSTVLYLVSFTDLAFAWSTTLAIDAESFHRLIKILASPFQSLSPQGFPFMHGGLDFLPSLEVIRDTQYFRFDDRYATAQAARRATDVQLLGQWWPFLVASLATYGLLPRLLMLGVAVLGVCRARYSFSAPALEMEAWRQRLGDLNEAKDQGESAESSGSYPGVPLAKLPVMPTWTSLIVLWRDLAVDEKQVQQLCADISWPHPLQILRAGGADFDLTGERIARVATDSKSTNHQPGRILIFVEDGEHADAALLGLLRRLSDELGRAWQLLLVPVQARRGQLRLSTAPLTIDRWRRQLQQNLADRVGLLQV